MAKHIDSIPFGTQLTLHRYQMINGLRVVLLPDKATPILSYHTWFGVGSRHERPGKTGLAHLLEHLMFSATHQHPVGDFDRLIEAAGGSNNAATWVDWTFYYENMPADALELCVELEADRMSNLVLHDAEVSSEIDVVANERKYRVEDDIEGKANEVLYALAYPNQGYGWPTIGWMDDIRSFTKEDCLNFYRTYYAPNNAVVVVVGDVEQERALDLIEAHYAEKRPLELPQENLWEASAQDKEQVANLQLPTQSHKLLLGYQAPAFGDPDHAALTVVADILFGGRSSRAVQRLVYQEEQCTSARASVMAFSKPSLFDIWISMRPGTATGTALDIVDEEIDRLAQEPPGTKELAKVRNQLELSFLHDMETCAGKAEQIGFYETVWGHSKGISERLEALRDVTAEDVTRTTAQYLKRDRRSRIVVEPEP